MCLDIDADAEDEEGHCGDPEKEANNNHLKGNPSQQQPQNQYHLDGDEHGHNNNSTGSPDEPSLNGEISIPLLRPKNVSLLQSQ